MMTWPAQAATEAARASDADLAASGSSGWDYLDRGGRGGDLPLSRLARMRAEAKLLLAEMPGGALSDSALSDSARSDSVPPDGLVLSGETGRHAGRGATGRRGGRKVRGRRARRGGRSNARHAAPPDRFTAGWRRGTTRAGERLAAVAGRVLGAPAQPGGQPAQAS